MLVLVTFIGRSLTWWNDGHMLSKKSIVFNIFLVAKIAYDILDKEDPSALESAEQLLKVLTDKDPSQTKSEKNYPFVECATFADEIKGRGGYWQSDWHFADFPYFDEGGSWNDWPKFKEEPHNVTAIIP